MNNKFRRLLASALNHRNQPEQQKREVEAEQSQSQRRLYKELRKKGLSEEEIAEKRRRVAEVMERGK